jgi:RHS repeat-associated protein
MTQFLSGLSFRFSGIVAFLALAALSQPAVAATVTISGSGLSQQSGSSACTYTAMSESSAGNWSVVCGPGGRTITFTPAVNGTICEGYTGMGETSAGDWTVQGCSSVAPTVTLDAPSQSGQTYATGAPYTLRATASAPAGRTITSVEFYSSATLIHAGTLSGGQYVWDWSPAAGTYLVFARATDNTGAISDSATREMAFQASSVIYYIHPDHLGAPRAITRASDNQLVWRWDNTEPFGTSSPNENPGGLGSFAYNLRFPGQYFDAETGTHYNYFRDYDPAIGRYVESDPIGLKGGINTYGYVSGSPVDAIDPRGLDAVIRYFPGGPAGHMGIGINTTNTAGLYPADHASYVMRFWLQACPTGKGTVAFDEPRQSDSLGNARTLVIKTIAWQDALMQKAIERAMNNSSQTYNICYNQCTNFVTDILRAGGVAVPGDPKLYPKDLFQQLSSMHGHR